VVLEAVLEAADPGERREAAPAAEDKHEALFELEKLFELEVPGAAVPEAALLEA